MRKNLAMVVHGEWGAGKSYFADTAPGPRLILDVEGGIDWTPSRKVLWDPRTPPPEVGPDDSVVVRVVDVDEIKRAYDWLASGQHQFRSVIIDSLTEAQMRFKDRIKGAGKMQLQDWGELGDKTISLVRAFRDLKIMPGSPIEAVIFVCGSVERGDTHPVVRPMLQGSAADTLIGQVDVAAYLQTELNEEGELQRRALFVQVNGISAKDRTGKLGMSMVAPTVPAILETVSQEAE